VHADVADDLRPCHSSVPSCHQAERVANERRTPPAALWVTAIKRRDEAWVAVYFPFRPP
jgi:hypothetical protein